MNQTEKSISYILVVAVITVAVMDILHVIEGNGLLILLLSGAFFMQGRVTSRMGRRIKELEALLSSHHERSEED